MSYWDNPARHADIDNRHDGMSRHSDGTALGCIGRCKVCGKAIQLRRMTMFNWDDKTITPGESDAWAHFVTSDHRAELSPGAGAYCDDHRSPI